MEFAHQGMVGGLADGLCAHMFSQWSKQSGKTNLVFKADFLIPKKQHLVAGERIFDFDDLAFRQSLCQIDIGDHCADVWRGRGHGDVLVGGCQLRRGAGCDGCADGAGEHVFPFNLRLGGQMWPLIGYSSPRECHGL